MESIVPPVFGLVVVIVETALIITILLWKLREQWEALDKDLQETEESDESSQ